MARLDGAPQVGMADIHVHTRYSDGIDSPADVLAWAARVRLDVIAITDHDSIAGAVIAAELARVRQRPHPDHPAARAAGLPEGEGYLGPHPDPLPEGEGYLGPEVVIGEEVSSLDGHILALFIEELVPPDMGAQKTIAAIHEQGGLAVAAHPYWRTASVDHKGRVYGLGDRIADLDLDAIEVINGGFTPSMIGANRRAGWVAEALGSTRVGGSDAHVRHALAWGHTRFQGATSSDLRHAIVTGRTEARRSRLHPTGIRRYAAWSIARKRLQAAV